MVLPWDRASILDNLRAPFTPTFHGSFEVGNRLNFCMYFGVGLGYMPNTVAASTERAFWGILVHLGKRPGTLVRALFLPRCSGGMTNV